VQLVDCRTQIPQYDGLILAGCCQHSPGFLMLRAMSGNHALTAKRIPPLLWTMRQQNDLISTEVVKSEISVKLTTTMMAVATLCTLASGCVSTQTAADQANTVRLKLDAAQDEAYLNP
jgi:hypothetical protein